MAAVNASASSAPESVVPPFSSGAAPSRDWQSVEFLRRLYRLIDTQSLKGVASHTGIAPASLYRLIWREVDPSYRTLLTLYRHYPDVFPELRVLTEDR